MNYTLQLHGERCLYPVPPGLAELTSDISREVLRAQPARLYLFVADYLETLVRVRAHARSAQEVVGEALAHNTELLALVGAVGASWSDANAAATRVQRAYRCYVARRDLKKKLALRRRKADALRAFESSESFREFLYSLNPDDAPLDSCTVLDAYEKFIGAKENAAAVEPVTKDASVHTIEVLPIASKPARHTASHDSKLLVYQQSPQPSIDSDWKSLDRLSAWSLVARETAARLAERKRQKHKGTLVYQQTPHPELTHAQFAEYLRSSSLSVGSDTESRRTLPTYYDPASSKIPMISEAGELRDDDKDVVTLYSTDSVGGGERLDRESFATTPSLSNLSRGKRLARELYEIIDPKSSEAQAIHTAASQVSRANEKISREVSFAEPEPKTVSRAESKTSRAASKGSGTSRASQGSKAFEGTGRSASKTASLRSQTTFPTASKTESQKQRAPSKAASQGSQTGSQTASQGSQPRSRTRSKNETLHSQTGLPASTTESALSKPTSRRSASKTESQRSQKAEVPSISDRHSQAASRRSLEPANTS